MRFEDLDVWKIAAKLSGSSLRSLTRDRRGLQKVGPDGGLHRGRMVAGFEKDLGDHCDTVCCVGVNSGTDALRFTLISIVPGNWTDVGTAYPGSRQDQAFL